MSKHKPTNEADPELVAQFNIAPTGETADNADVLSQLLGDAPSDDADEATEMDLGELGALQEEFDAVETLTLQKQRLEAKLSKVSADLQAQKFRMLDAMKLQGTKQFSSALGPGACSRSERYDTVVEDVDTFMAWVQETHPELLSVHSQRRTKFIRENFRDQGVPEDDERFPPGVKVTAREQLVVRGVKLKAPQGGSDSGKS